MSASNAAERQRLARQRYLTLALQSAYANIVNPAQDQALSAAHAACGPEED